MIRSTTCSRVFGDAPAEEFQVDLERYPRTEDSTPDWFRAQLSTGQA
ncbi:hypothetical protein [Saccharopolyspora elongata]|nr:hypothetical protein [Saccharopolyspora elongata]